MFQCDLFIQEGARLGRTPAEVASMCDITFSCVSDPKAARDVSTLHCRAWHVQRQSANNKLADQMDPRVHALIKCTDFQSESEWAGL